ncbi:hypothetical protein FLX07_31515 [Microbispora bryophytorum]|nr:hypothetical protein FLX07_31515 [Microbispora bryophytorum]
MSNPDTCSTSIPASTRASPAPGGITASPAGIATGTPSAPHQDDPAAADDEPGPHPDTHPDTHPGAHTDADTGPDPGAHTGADTDADTGADEGAGEGADTVRDPRERRRRRLNDSRPPGPGLPSHRLGSTHGVRPPRARPLGSPVTAALTLSRTHYRLQPPTSTNVESQPVPRHSSPRSTARASSTRDRRPVFA